MIDSSVITKAFIMDSFLSSDPLYHVAMLREIATELYRKKINAIKIEGFLPSYTPILIALHNKKQMTLNDLVQVLRKPKSTVSDMVKKLELLGLIQKEVSSEDQRITNISLTKKSEKILPELTTIINEVKNEIYSDFTNKEQEIFIKMLKKAIKSIS